MRVEVVLGNGWYRGDLGFEGANANYGTEIGFLAELVIRYADGTTQTVVTDHVLDRPRLRTPRQQPVRRPDHRRPAPRSGHAAADPAHASSSTGPP